MLFWCIRVVIVSIIFIFLVHNIIYFLKDTLTTPKIKDLVNIPTKYENIQSILSKQHHHHQYHPHETPRQDARYPNRDGIYFVGNRVTDAQQESTTLIENINTTYQLDASRSVEDRVTDAQESNKVTDMKAELASFISTLKMHDA